MTTAEIIHMETNMPTAKLSECNTGYCTAPMAQRSYARMATPSFGLMAYAKETRDEQTA